MTPTRRLAAARGALAWAIVACVPDTPHRLWCGDGVKPLELPDAASLAREVSHQSPQLDRALLVEARLRPVLLLQDRPRDVLRDAVALAVVGLEQLSDAQRASVREQREPSLFHLPVRPNKYGLHREMAVDLNALVRIGASAILPRSVGRLDDNEMRVIGERLVEHLDIDLELVIARQVEERLAQLTQPAIL